jgi:hypothetical protein
MSYFYIAVTKIAIVDFGSQFQRVQCMDTCPMSMGIQLWQPECVVEEVLTSWWAGSRERDTRMIHPQRSVPSDPLRPARS